MKNQKGQVVLILVLVMTVALAIGISVIQRSISDVSTAGKVEQSSRAFSAAEAGIEKAIQSGGSITAAVDLGNSSQIDNVQAVPVPSSYQALEYPPLAKEEMAQVWLADPVTLNQFYNRQDLDIYWGLQNISNPDEKPAIEISVIFLNGTYQSKKFFFDSDAGRRAVNHFADPAGCSNNWSITTSRGTERKFLCRTTLTGLQPVLILLRARLLYSSISQPLAVQPLGGSCGNNSCSLPVQGKLFTSTGIAGQTQRKIEVLRLDKVVPPYFDFAIFSKGSINK